MAKSTVPMDFGRRAPGLGFDGYGSADCASVDHVVSSVPGHSKRRGLVFWYAVAIALAAAWLWSAVRAFLHFVR
jgi:hypothetical protein